MFPTLPVPSKAALLSVLSNLLGLGALVALPVAVGQLAGGSWALLVCALEAGGMSYLVGLAAQQAKAKAGPRPVRERAAA